MVMKVANDFFAPELFVTYRFLSGAIVLLAVAFFVKLPKPPKKILGVDCFDGRIANCVLLSGNANLFQVHERGNGGDAQLHDADMGNDFGEIFPQRNFDD